MVVFHIYVSLPEDESLLLARNDAGAACLLEPQLPRSRGPRYEPPDLQGSQESHGVLGDLQPVHRLDILGFNHVKPI